MTLRILPEHDIRTMHQEPCVTHLHFRNETGMQRFLTDNRKALRSVHEQWTVDWEPLLTVTAR